MSSASSSSTAAAASSSQPAKPVVITGYVSLERSVLGQGSCGLQEPCLRTSKTQLPIFCPVCYLLAFIWISGFQGWGGVARFPGCGVVLAPFLQGASAIASMKQSEGASWPVRRSNCGRSGGTAMGLSGEACWLQVRQLEAKAPLFTVLNRHFGHASPAKLLMEGVQPSHLAIWLKTVALTASSRHRHHHQQQQQEAKQHHHLHQQQQQHISTLWSKTLGSSPPMRRL